jgi:hypothetical protein
VTQNFNLAAFEAVVGGAVWAGADQAFDLNAKFIAQAFSGFEHVGAIGIANHLHIAFAITHVYKDHAAMVTTAIDPTAQADSLTHESFSDEAAIV